jgi:hypothetical protein
MVPFFFMCVSQNVSLASEKKGEQWINARQICFRRGGGGAVVHAMCLLTADRVCREKRKGA